MGQRSSLTGPATGQTGQKCKSLHYVFTFYSVSFISLKHTFFMSFNQHFFIYEKDHFFHLKHNFAVKELKERVF